MSAPSLVKLLFRVGFSEKDFYGAMHGVYRRFYGEDLMLHFPLCRRRGEGLLRCQENLTDYCLALLPDLRDQQVLEIGCGNGVQSRYIIENYRPARLTGVDLSRTSIAIARARAAVPGRLLFLADDAQTLARIEDRSVDTVLNVESAFHYPDKRRFLAQIRRVLKPNGRFLIADIINRGAGGSKTLAFWQRRMNLHHWTLEEYRSGLRTSGLRIHHQEDITSLLLHGFRHTRIWSKTFLAQGMAAALMGYLWGRATMAVYSLLLLSLRRYYLFVGQKSAS